MLWYIHTLLSVILTWYTLKPCLSSLREGMVWYIHALLSVIMTWYTLTLFVIIERGHVMVYTYIIIGYHDMVYLSM
jgi:hypothetical protein